MLDIRLETFLKLCELKNYTRTAEALHMTQPAVTQHIHFLEARYGAKLVSAVRGRFCLTENGRALYRYAARLAADARRLEMVVSAAAERPVLSFGATLTIGEFLLPKRIERLHEYRLSVTVENTKELLDRLLRGEISFALVEGSFNKADYGYRFISHEPFIAVCAPNSRFASGNFQIEDLLDNRLILRERGSGGRDILESALKAHNFSIESFADTAEIGSVGAMKALACKGYGVAFLYRAACEEELKDGRLVSICLPNFSLSHEFNFVYLKNSVFEEEYTALFDKLQAPVSLE